MDQQKVFYATIGLLVAIALGLTGYRLLVIGSDISAAEQALDQAGMTMESEIIAQGESAPNRSWPVIYGGRATDVQRVLKECYKEYGETDDVLESWMDENLQPKPGDRPPGGEGPWKARYNDRGNTLKAELEKKGIKVGVEPKHVVGPLGGGSARTPTREDEGGLGFVDPADMRLDVKVYQKQWWIQERFVKAVMATPNVTRVERVEFPVEAAPADTSAPPPAAAAPQTTYHKPAVIKVRFTLQVMFGEVARLVTNLLKLDNELPIRFSNLDLRVVKLSTLDQKPTDVDDIKEEVQKEGFDFAKWKPIKDVTPMPVRVEITADVLDFNIPKEVR